MLRWRLILGTVIVAALVGLCWLDYQAARPGVFLLPLAVVLSLVGAGELLAMFRQRGHEPLAWVVYCGTLVTVLAAGAPVFVPSGWIGGVAVGRLGWLAIGLAAGMSLAIIGELRRYESPGSATMNLALSTFAVLYVGGLMGFLVQLRLLRGGPWGIDGRWGIFALVSLIAIVKMSDIGQYTAGRLFGKDKLASTISPGKTWQGAVGGLICGFATSWALFFWGPDLFGLSVGGGWRGGYGKLMVPLTAALYGLALAVAGIIGDLAESLLKRDAGVKDSSTWLPGYGGALDMLDSLLGAAPVAYLFWALGIVGP